MIIMLARNIIKRIDRVCRSNNVSPYLPYITLIPLGFLLRRSLTSTTSTTSPPAHRLPPIPKKEDEIFSYIAVSEDPSKIQKVLELINQDPARVMSYDRRGRLPLHVLCQQSFPDRDLLRSVIEAYPDAVSMTDKFFSALPIHMAVHRGTLLAIYYITYWDKI